MCVLMVYKLTHLVFLDHIGIDLSVRLPDLFQVHFAVKLT